MSSDAQTRAPQQAIDTTITGLRGELSRCDTKASIVLALPLAVLAGIANKALDGDLRHLPVPAAIAGALGSGLLMTATVLLLLAIMPSLKGGGWPSWARLSTAEVAARIAAGQNVAEAHALACSTDRKYRRVGLGIRAILAGLGLLALAVVLDSLL